MDPQTVSPSSHTEQQFLPTTAGEPAICVNIMYKMQVHVNVVLLKTVIDGLLKFGGW